MEDLPKIYYLKEIDLLRLNYSIKECMSDCYFQKYYLGKYCKSDKVINFSPFTIWSQHLDNKETEKGIVAYKLCKLFYYYPSYKLDAIMIEYEKLLLLSDREVRAMCTLRALSK
jgi:hypothetical protein